MNKTEYFLDARMITDERDNGLDHTSIVGPYEVTPSLMFEPSSAFSVAIRFSTLDSHWSDTVYVNNINETKENTKCVLVASELQGSRIIPCSTQLCNNTLFSFICISVPKIVDGQTTFDSVVCHFVFETIDGVPQLLVCKKNSIFRSKV